MAKKPPFDSVTGFALSSANAGELVSIGFQINVSDTDNEMKLTLTQGILDSVVYPEIINRALEKKLDPNFQILRYAHLIMFSNPSKNKLLLNDDVQIRALVEFVDGAAIQENDPIKETDIKKILAMYPSKKTDPNAAHILLAKLKGKWYFASDLIYSKKRVKNLIVTSEKFLDTATTALEKKNWGPFVDNLFSVNELLVQSILLLRYYQSYSKKQTHDKTSKLFKGFCETGNAPMEFFENFDKLWKLRRPARYLEGTDGDEFVLEREKAKEFIDITIKIFDYINNLIKNIDLKSTPANGRYISLGSKTQ